jgi:hypothetical protein
MTRLNLKEALPMPPPPPIVVGLLEAEAGDGHEAMYREVLPKDEVGIPRARLGRCVPIDVLLLVTFLKKEATAVTGMSDSLWLYSPDEDEAPMVFRDPDRLRGGPPWEEEPPFIPPRLVLFLVLTASLVMPLRPRTVTDTSIISNCRI